MVWKKGAVERVTCAISPRPMTPILKTCFDMLQIVIAAECIEDEVVVVVSPCVVIQAMLDPAAI